MKEKAALAGGSLTEGTTKKLQGSEERQLWPENVELLTEHGIKFVHRIIEKECRFDCPFCGGNLTIHESKPWHHCDGVTCPTFIMPFCQVVMAMPAPDEVEK